MKKIKLKPSEGYKIRKPNGDFLKEAGEEVLQSSYWRRRIQFGEVTIVKLGNAQIAKVATKKPEEKKAETKKAEPKKKVAKKAATKKTDDKKAKESK